MSKTTEQKSEMPVDEAEEAETADGGEEEKEDRDVATFSRKSESVWLLAGKNDSSYAAFSEAVSVVSEDEERATGGGGCLSHLVAIGPDTPGGQTAAIGRLAR